MSRKNNGSRSQLIGERAETKVRDTLLDGGIFCSKYENDRGEDLLVELEGYFDQTEFKYEPRIGLLQIKGHEEVLDFVDENFVRKTLKLDHLRRWAAIPLPVFIIAVELVVNTPHFFACSVDKLVEKIAPDGLDALEQQQITVSLSRVDLVTFLKQEIVDFYSLHAFQLSGLSESVIARNHYEIISSNTPIVSQQAKVWMKNIRVLWKGPWRPAHFWATLNHLADQLQSEANRHVPLMATVHIYRSLKDMRDNNAIAHTSWLEDTHCATDQLKLMNDWPKAASWSRFRFNGKSALESLPDPSVEVSDESFLLNAEVVWSKFDEVYLNIKNALTSDLRMPNDLQHQLEEVLNEFDLSVVDKLGKPSPQLVVLDRMIDQYNFVLFGIFTWLKGKDDVPEIRRQRWLRQDLKLAEGLYLAFQPLSKILRDG